MPRLIVYVPFPRQQPEGDLRTNVNELAQHTNVTLGNFTITTVVDVFVGEEAAANNQVAAGDVLLVHAHGGPDDYLDLTDNMGSDITLDNLLNNLNTLGAQNASASYFFACYSGQANHVAAVWKTNHPNQVVYGSHQAVSGGIIRKTRQGIRDSVFHAGNQQLALLP